MCSNNMDYFYEMLSYYPGNTLVQCKYGVEVVWNEVPIVHPFVALKAVALLFYSYF